MKKISVKVLCFLFFIIITCSCTSEDISPDKVSTEIKVTCFLTNYLDTTASKEVWVGCTNDGYARIKNFIGHCWNYNTDTLPTIKSEIKKVAYVNGTWTSTSSYNLSLSGQVFSFTELFQTGIPVSENDIKLIVRSFIIFNDSLIRYSDPLILNNPMEYAN